LGSFAQLVRRLRSRIGVLSLPELLDDVLEVSGYRAMLADGTEEGEERWANLLELREVTRRYDDLSPEDALDRLLEETALVADQDAYESNADALSLITLHAAKGLEFPVVFIAGLEEGLFPTSRALDAAGGFNPDPRPLEEERRLAYVGITRAKRRLYLSHAWRRATWGMGQASVPSRFLLEIPAELMIGPRLGGIDEPERDLDLDLVFGQRRTTRFNTPTRGPVRAYRQGSGRPGAPRDGEAFRPSRDLAARREAFEAGAPSGSLGAGPTPAAPAKPPRPVIPGERQFRDGDRVRHGRWGDGIVVTSKLTRSDEEITVAFKDPGVGRKTMLASLANLELVG
jgi:DNA helicase-2/ATP-dependent DNA helicase PcrA